MVFLHFTKQQSMGLNYMHSWQCTPRACSLLHNVRVWISDRKPSTVGGEMHWGFILLHPVDFCMGGVVVCTLKCVHTWFTHSRSYWQLLQSLKGGEWKCLSTSSSTKKAESQTGKPLGFVSIFPFKRSCVAGGQVAAVPVALFLLVSVLTSS